MFRFKKEMKKALLKGRTVRYIANNEVFVNEFYLVSQYFLQKKKIFNKSPFLNNS